MNNRRRISVVAIIVAAAFVSGGIFYTTIAHGDRGAIEGAAGGSLRSYNDDNIQMVSETINMTITDAVRDYTVSPHADVQVDYHFLNTTNRPITVLTGFPERDQGQPLQNFSTYVDGKQVVVSKQPGQAVTDPVTGDTYTEYWYTYKMTFAPGQTLNVRDTYEQGAIGGEGDGGYFATYPYILDTGATWKDNIQSVSFVINLKNVDVHDINSLQPLYPNNLWQESADGKTLTLTLHDIKPTTADDFSLAISNGGNNIANCNFKNNTVYQIDRPDVATSTSVKTPTTTPDISMAYYPCQAFDADTSTAWISADGDNPIGQRLTYYLSGWYIGREIDSIYVLGGLQASGNGMNVGANYTDYARPKKIKLTLSSPTTTLYSTDLDIPDNSAGSLISLPQRLILVSSDTEAQPDLNIQILDVYPGKKYYNLAISEFNLKSIPADTFIETSSPQTLTIPNTTASSDMGSSEVSSNLNEKIGAILVVLFAVGLVIWGIRKRK